jgi:PAS domain S-box-containing protein
MYKIDRTEALGPGDDRARRLLLVFLFAIAAIAAAVIAAWRHGTSVRAARAAADYEQMARRYEAQSRFLRQVTDSQPAAMFIVDPDNRYTFANRIALNRAGIGEADLIGKTLASVLGPADARRYEGLNREVLQTGERRMQIVQSGANGDLRVVQSEHIPIAEGSDRVPGIMIVEEDITSAVAERERRERTLQRLIDTLVAVLDRRDPHAANHSLRVAAVARSIALEMGLGGADARTAEIAGQLMNIGKALVPAEMLTRDGALGEDEMRMVRDSLQSGAALLEGIEFDGPVVETLRQMYERWDGGGAPAGLAGDEIFVTAQIVAVANAFVALTSPRAWREAVDPEAAAGRLMAETGGAFARRVVSALMNLVDNRNLRNPGTIAGDAAAIH